MNKQVTPSTSQGESSATSRRVHEILVISGKGGTGKTSITAALAVLEPGAVVADCDVDASDLDLVLSPNVLRTVEFYSGRGAVVRPDACTGCGVCHELCRFGAIVPPKTGDVSPFLVDSAMCEGCGVCVAFCPEKAIDFPEQHAGTWFVSDTRRGPMVHARLGVAAENSGKLVSTVRIEAQKLAKGTGLGLVLIDGPPGIGCPVIASLTGASLALVVTEPTLSGLHDLKRVLSLAQHFGVATMVAVNKWDLNEDMTNRIEKRAVESGAALAGRIRYDTSVTTAQNRGLSIVEMDSVAGEDVARMWKQVRKYGSTLGVRFTPFEGSL